ncbi:cryptochrome/DNA photolyase family protein [Thalassoglobus polymorphus]|uniref:Deoxyribodipyrimidine photo-lyase n=1 Tax=Thalassoglobus polymorphus TaxID=2527994 RepID=A0A517QGV2_9PLAN|nr:deoxyribodipyrimidine photolyase [Thalassoglobus polymorphus]QDT30862.1 Deoxyribodipyrimidine photo-lyase [Thalassoglobus polymorphus]
MNNVPEKRIRALNNHDVNPSGDYILYWMIANRRSRSNFSLERAAEWAQRLGKPLIVFEAVRVKYRWASDRLHKFILQGMANQRESFKNAPLTYYCYVEPEPNDGKGLLEELAKKACVVVTDDFPCFFIPTMLKVVSRRVKVKLEAVDSNGLFPMSATDRVFTKAHSFRRFLQKEILEHLDNVPNENFLNQLDLPQTGEVPQQILSKWPEATDLTLTATADVLKTFPIDHAVKPASFDGGEVAATRTLKEFLDDGFERYADDRNHPDTDASSRLSPYLHFGHISAHTIFSEIAAREGWTPANVAEKPNGSREGWWGMSEHAEGYLDEVITWRELGYNMCSHESNYDKYESLPDWAKTTLEEHLHDEREYVYSLSEFESASTHDEVWNAAQRQLVQEGRMHNYLRMLWGKKIFEWSETPRDAIQIMIELNNKYAVDGRNPNSYSGIFWVLGRYDRAWGPERSVYGKIRYMTSESTKRKLKMKEYLKRYSSHSKLF